MLKGISPLISPELLKALDEMGHGDMILFSDAFFPATTCAQRLIRADGIPCDQLLKAIAPLFELDTYSVPLAMTAPVPGDTLDPTVEARYRAALDYTGKIDFISRDELYVRAKKCFAVCITGETAKYGNLFLTKGVTPVS